MARISHGQMGASMANPELQTAPKKVWEDHERAATLTQRMRPLTKEREWKVVRLFASQKREYNDLLNHLVETRQREELIQEARAAAQRAIRRIWPRATNGAGSGRGWLAKHVDCISYNMRDFVVLETAILENKTSARTRTCPRFLVDRLRRSWPAPCRNAIVY